MNRAVAYAPPIPEQQADPISYPHLVPSSTSQGVGHEATEVAQLWESLRAKLNKSETLRHALADRLDEHTNPIEYDHVQARHVGTVRVRYRNVGKLAPREISIDDE